MLTKSMITALTVAFLSLTAIPAHSTDAQSCTGTCKSAYHDEMGNCGVTFKTAISDCKAAKEANPDKKAAKLEMKTCRKEAETVNQDCIKTAKQTLKTCKQGCNTNTSGGLDLCACEIGITEWHPSMNHCMAISACEPLAGTADQCKTPEMCEEDGGR